jgi:hypothetical protein
VYLNFCQTFKYTRQHAGPDLIPTQFLRELAPIIAPMLTTLFQASINEGTIPPEWKEANVVPTLLWIRDFLSSRNQRVLVEGQSSQTAPVCSGVPQGSVLGPLMFLLFINDLPDYVKSCNVRLFADDFVLYRRIHRASDMQSLLDDMDNLLQWEQDWQMEFHPSKCQLLNYVSPTNVSHLTEIMIYMDTN